MVEDGGGGGNKTNNGLEIKHAHYELAACARSRTKLSLSINLI